MDYGSAVWGGPLYSKCDTVQQRAMRTILGVGRQTPIPFLYFDLGWTPPNIHQKLETVRLWYHIINSPQGLQLCRPSMLNMRYFRFGCEFRSSVRPSGGDFYVQNILNK